MVGLPHVQPRGDGWGGTEETQRCVPPRHPRPLCVPAQLLAPAVVGEETPVQVVFQNPLPDPLSGATLRMEGAGISCPKAFHMG